jgi:hypothetical protein
MSEIYSQEFEWPAQRFRHVPENEVAVELAAQTKIRRPIRPILSILGIEVVDREMSGSYNALMTVNWKPDKHFILLYDPAKPLARNRFGIEETDKEDFILGHELGHTFFYDWRPGDYSREVKILLYRYNIMEKNQALEDFCDVFSLALLEQQN